jgi:hypothetical protein
MDNSKNLLINKICRFGSAIIPLHRMGITATTTAKTSMKRNAKIGFCAKN